MSLEHHALGGRISLITLPPLRILNTKEKLQIDSTASISVDLPGQLQHVTTADDLLEATEKDNLWIARLGTCCVEVSATVNGDPILDPHHVSTFSEKIKKCEVSNADISSSNLPVLIILVQLWCRLGVRLEGDGTSALQLPGLVSFSIQHPDLASALLPPSATLVARFRTLKLSINLSNLGTIGAPKEARPRREKKRKMSSEGKEEITARTMGDALFSNLDFNDRQAIDAFMMSLNLPSQDSRNDYLQPTPPPNLVIEDVLEKCFSLYLIDTLLEQLLLGPGKRCKGPKIIGGTASHCLTRLCPAVFHVPYLKVIVQHASRSLFADIVLFS